MILSFFKNSLFFIELFVLLRGENLSVSHRPLIFSLFYRTFRFLKKVLLPSFPSVSLSKSAVQSWFSLFYIELFGFSLFFIEPPDIFLWTKCRIFESTKSVPEGFSLFYFELIESFGIFLSFLSNFRGQKCLIYAVCEDLTLEKTRW